jgi:large exoprotein involved in heme utilization and adhesion
MTLTDGARIDSGTTGAGAGGTIDVVAGAVTLSGAGSGLFSNATGSGPGGSITVAANQMSLLGGATISATSTGTAEALAGSINITFGDSLKMQNSSITTDSVLADGGNITITSTGSELLLIDSQITTSVRSGLGGGGNIALGSFGHPLSIIVLDDSGIHADAFGGPGGNINIFTDVLLANTPIETTITASSQLSSSGTISINAFVSNLSSSLAELPSGLLQVAALLRASCAARMAEGKASSLVVAGREGVPPEPGGLLPSGLSEPRVARTATNATAFLSTELPSLRLWYLDPKCGG